MKIKFPWSKPADTHKSKTDEAMKFADDTSDRNTAWFEKTGQKPEQRSGFREESAQLQHLLDEADVINRDENEGRVRERKKIEDRIEAGEKLSTKLKEESGFEEWKNKRGPK